MPKKTIAVACPYVDHKLTAGKIRWLATWLQQAGYDPLLLGWDDELPAVAGPGQLPLLKLSVTHATVDPIAASQEFVALLTQRITDDPDSPTWGQMLGFDDFLGMAHGYVLNGADSLRPDAVVTTIPGSESQTPEDSIVALALWRFCTQNKIPRIGVECSSLVNDLRLLQWPVDVLLTKDDPRTEPRTAEIAPQCFQMPVTHRYALSLSSDPLIDEFLKEEHQLRQRFGPPGTRFLFMPFHLAFKERFVRMLDATAPHAAALKAAGYSLLIAIDPNSFRRNLTEHDIVNVGLRRWLEPWAGHIVIVGGCLGTWLALLSDAVLACVETGLTEQCERWRQPVIRHGEEHRLADLACGISVAEAVAWTLGERKAEQ